MDLIKSETSRVFGKIYRKITPGETKYIYADGIAIYLEFTDVLSL